MVDVLVFTSLRMQCGIKGPLLIGVPGDVPSNYVNPQVPIAGDIWLLAQAVHYIEEEATAATEAAFRVVAQRVVSGLTLPGGAWTVADTGAQAPSRWNKELQICEPVSSPAFTWRLNRDDHDKISVDGLRYTNGISGAIGEFMPYINVQQI